ncbi:MAG: N-acetylmuramoyl-L-alanine amidase [Chlamydiota bacterium]|jgi:N-acetylmuramoyl-L-alanine amidase
MKKIITFLIAFFAVFSIQAKPSYKGTVKPVIMIDAGHGGLDIGTKGRRPYCEEKRIALSTAILTKKYLDQLGYKCVLTRSTDVFLPLATRVKKANVARSSLFISLHYNHSPNATAHGIEIFYCDAKNSKKIAVASQRLASNVLKQVIKRTKAKSRGVKKGNFYVIRETKIPAVLLEGGFISNDNERTNLKNSKYIDKIARGIADGVDRYFKS